MTFAEEKFRELDIRINLLIEKCKELSLVKESMMMEINILNAKIKDQQIIVEKFEEKKILTETENTFDNKSDEIIKTKQTINEMMREIDQCLLLLEE